MVEIFNTRKDLLQRRAEIQTSTGFVPTMGNLHDGHLSLLEKALNEHETVFFSIFVNPKQFGPNEDFSRYPRTFEADVEKLQSVAKKFPNKKVILFTPRAETEIFPHEENQMISVHKLSTELEGKIRPGHFDGVATVVYRLFELIRPQTAYFGLKDYQQYMVIKQMVKDLVLPIKIQGMPIIRETSGLALSSRNQYLSPEQKKASLLLFETLSELKEILKNQKSEIPKVQKKIDEKLQDKDWDYLEMRDSETFSRELSKSKNISFLAVYRMGTTRLLDNMQVEVE